MISVVTNYDTAEIVHRNALIRQRDAMSSSSYCLRYDKLILYQYISTAVCMNISEYVPVSSQANSLRLLGYTRYDFSSRFSPNRGGAKHKQPKRWLVLDKYLGPEI